MSNRTLFYFIIVVFLGIAILFGRHLFYSFDMAADAKYISPFEVKGIEVEHRGKAYPLNFSQQMAVLKILNQAINIGYEKKLESKELKFDFTKLTIYRFEDHPLLLTPITLVNQQLIFYAPEWNKDGLIRETGPGRLLPLLEASYDS